MKVLVLGAGPSGLIACHAAALAGHDVLVYSKDARKSRLYGCQYLHAPIPAATRGEPVEVKYLLDGTPEDYREKVYGSRRRVKVSPDEFGVGEDHLAWDLRLTYDTLWGMYGSFIQPMEFDHPEMVSDLIEELEPDKTISSIPAPATCLAEDAHGFDAELVWAMGDSPEQQAPVPVPENTVQCNGEPDVSWYRASNVFGFKTVEWPGKRRPPYDGVAQVSKPLKTSCNCHSDDRTFLPVGRYGRWQKGVLSHEAFVDTLTFLGDRPDVPPGQEMLF